MAFQAIQSDPAGTMKELCGGTVPTGYLLCDGSSLLRADFPKLFNQIGTAWGAVDGTHFNVPDMRGYVARGRDAGVGRDPNAATRGNGSSQGGTGATGQATGDNVGSVQGFGTAASNQVNLSSGNNSVGHTHTVNPGSINSNGTGGNGRNGLYGVNTVNNSLDSGGTGGTWFNATNDVSANHTHVVSTGGDPESRMRNAYVEFIIKY